MFFHPSPQRNNIICNFLMNKISHLFMIHFNWISYYGRFFFLRTQSSTAPCSSTEQILLHERFPLPTTVVTLVKSVKVAISVLFLMDTHHHTAVYFFSLTGFSQFRDFWLSSSARNGATEGAVKVLKINFLQFC